MIELHKDKGAKNRDDSELENTYLRAAYTAKLLTKDMVEGSTPICQIIAKHTENKITRQEVLLILYRCRQLFTVKTDVQKVLYLLIKALYDPDCIHKSKETQLRLWRRIQLFHG